MTGIASEPLSVPTYDAQHFAPRSWHRCDVPSAGGGLQRRHQVVRLPVAFGGQVDDVLFFDRVINMEVLRPVQGWVVVARKAVAQH
jgi:hypothetical protein